MLDNFYHESRVKLERDHTIAIIPLYNIGNLFARSLVIRATEI